MTRNHAPNSRSHDQTFQRNSAGFGCQGLEEESEDGNAGDIVEEAREILHAEEHGDGVEPGGCETDGDSAHNGDRDHLFGPVDFFGKMRGAVKAGECPVGVDQTYDESWVVE